MISGEYRHLSQVERRAGRFRAYLLGRTALCGALTLGIASAIAPKPAKAGPQGTVVVGGAVDMAQTGTHTEFTQHTPTAILNHNSFDIQRNESVNFAQPSANALAVNRVVGSDLPTNIAGQLTANGNVWVLNPSGVAVQGTAQVNVGGLIATTAGISDEAVMAGQRSFAGAPDGSAVTNAGSITAGGGSVVLVAPVVENTGTITAQGGDVALGAGSGFTVDFDGDGLTRFEVTPGNGVRLSNTGTISAQGGAAYLSAASAEAVQTAVVSIGGKVEATRIEEKGGVIVISGGDRGITEVSGTVDASQATGRGGKVIATGELVDIKETARIDASGATDGGTVEIGGGFQGAAIGSDVVVTAGAPASSPLPTARRTVVRRGAEIRADAGTQGDGGEIIIWADEATSFRGAISARGGEAGGDGGFAEVSGKQNLLFDGTVDMDAPLGRDGSLLLDPAHVSIVANSPAPNDAELDDDSPTDGTNDIGFGEGAGATFFISALALEQAVNSADTIIQATETITQEAAVALFGNTNALRYETQNGDITFLGSFTGNGGDFRVLAGGNIIVDAGATISNTGDVRLDAFGAVSVLANVTGDNLGIFSDTDFIGDEGIVLGGGVTITGGPGSILLPASGGLITDSGAGGVTIRRIGDAASLVLDGGGVFDEGGLTLSAEAANPGALSGNVQQGDPLVVTGGDLTITTQGGSVTLGNTANNFGTVTVDTTAGARPAASVTLVDANSIDLGAITASALTVTAIEIDTTAAVDVTGGTVTLTRNGSGRVEIGGGDVAAFSISDADIANITATNLVVNSSGGAIDLNAADLDAFTLVTLNAGGGAVSIDEFQVSGPPNPVIRGTTTVADLTILNATTYSHENASASVNDRASARLEATGTVSISASGSVTLGDMVAGALDIRGADIDTFSQGGDTATVLVGAGNGTIIATNAEAASPTAVGGAADTGFSILDADIARWSFGRLIVDAGGGAATLAALDTSDDTFNSDTTKDIEIRSDDILITGAVDLGATGTLRLVDTRGDGGGMSLGVGPLGEDLDENSYEVTALGLSSITAGTLEFDSDGGDIDVQGGDYSTFGLVRIDAGAGALDFAAALTFQDLTVADLADSSQPGAGTVTQTAGSLSVTGDARFVVDGDVVLDGANDFSTNTIHVDAAGNVTVNDVNAIGLGAFDVTGNLVVTAGGAITDSAGQQIKVRGTTSLLASDGGAGRFDITLDNSVTGIHDFDEDISGDALTFDGANVTIRDVDRLTLGASTATGTLTLAAMDFDLVGTVTVGGGTGTATLNSSRFLLSGGTIGGFAFTPSEPAQDADLNGFNSGFTSADAGNLDTGSTTFRIDATVADPNASSITSDAIPIVVMHFDGGTAIGDVTLQTTGAGEDISFGSDTVGLNPSGAIFGGGLTLIATGDIIQREISDSPEFDQPLTVAGTLSISADAVTLDNAENDFQGTVAVDANSATLVDANAIVLGDLDIVNNLTVTSGGSITDDGVSAAGDDINVGGLASLSAAGNIVLDDLFNDFSTSTVNAAGVNITLVDANDIGLGDIDATGDLTVVAGGSISDSDAVAAGDGIDVGGATSLSAVGDVTLDDVVNDFDLGGSGDALTATGVNVSLADANAIVLGTTDAGGTLTVRALGGSITSTGSVSVAGVTSLSATGAVTLDDVATNFDDDDTGDAVDVSGADVALVDASAIRLGAVSASSLAVTAGGTIEDTAGSSISVTGTTSLLASDGGTEFFDIVLDNADTGTGDIHDFGGAVTATGEDIALVNGRALLGGFTTNAADGAPDGAISGNGGDLTIRAAGSVTQSAGWTIAGDLNVTAQGLVDATQFFDIFLSLSNTIGGVFSASGEDVRLVNAGLASLEIGTVVARDSGLDTTLIPFQGNGTFQVFSDGGANDGNGGSITANALFVRGTGADFIFDNEDSHTVGLLTSALGGGTRNVTLNNEQGISLSFAGATLALVGKLEVSAEGSIIQAANRIVAADVSLSAVDDAGTNFFDILLANTGNEFSGRIDMAGEDISLVNAAAGGTQFGTLTTNADGSADGTITGAAGTLSVTSSGGAITDTAGRAITVAGSTSLLAQSGGGDFFDILLGNVDTHDFADTTVAGSFSAEGEDIFVDDLDAIALGNVTAHDDSALLPDFTLLPNTGALTIRADGAIVQLGGTSVVAPGAGNFLTSSGAITLTESGNDFADEGSGSTLSLSATGGVAVVDTDSVAIGNATGTSLSVTATDVSIGSVSITGTAGFTNGAGDLMVLGAAAADASGDTFEISDADLLGIVAASEVRLTTAAGGILVQGVQLSPSLTLQAGTGGVAFSTGANSVGGNLAITAGDTVEQDAFGALTVTGTTGITAGDGVAGFVDILLANIANDFRDEVTASGGDISLADADGIVLNGIDANGNFDPTIGSNDGSLSVVAVTGSIEDTATGKIDVEGATSLLASGGGSILLDNGLHDFDSDGVDAAKVSAEGGQIHLTDSTAIVLGTVTASEGLTVTAGGTITDTPFESIQVAGATSLLAQEAATFFDIVLDTLAHDFDSDGSAANGRAVTATGQDITLADANFLELGAVTATTAGADLGDLTVRAANTLTQSGILTVPGTATFISDVGNIALALGNRFGGVVNAAGRNITLVDADIDSSGHGIVLGDIDAVGNLTVTALDGNIIDDGVSSDGGDVDVAGATSLSASGGIRLDDAFNNFDADAGALADATDRVDATGADVTLVDEDAILLGRITTSALTISAGGSITDTGAPISVSGTTSLKAGASSDFFDILLDGDDASASDRPHELIGTVHAAGEDITIVNGRALQLGTVTANPAGATADLTINQGNDGDLSLSAAGGIRDTGTAPITAGGRTVLLARSGDGGTFFDIVLDNATHDFDVGGSGDVVDATGLAISLRDANSIVLGRVDARGSLTVRAGGAIGDSGALIAGQGVEVVGVTSLSATGDILLDDIANDFDTDATGDAVNAAGDNISLTDANAILLGDIDATRTATSGLTVRALNGTISDGGSQGVGQDVNVSGVTSLSATGNITLDDPSNDFGGRVDASGDTIRLGDINTIILGDIDAVASAGSALFVRAASIIDDGAGSDGGDIDVRGTTSLSATGAITLDDPFHNFDSDAGGTGFDAIARVDVIGGAVTLNDEDAILLGSVTASSLTVTAGGSITDTASAISVTGATSLQAGSGTDFFDIVLDGDDPTLRSRVHQFSASSPFSAVGEDIVITNGQGLQLGTVTTNPAGSTPDATFSAGNDGDLTISVGGAITDSTGQSISVAGETVIEAGTFGAVTTPFGVLLDNLTHDFDTGGAADVVHVFGSDIVLSDTNSITLGTIIAANDLTVRAAAGTISDSGGGIEVAGDTSLSATGDITLDDVVNEFGGGDAFAAGPGRVDAAGQNISLADATTIVLGDIDASGALTVTSGGSIRDDGAGGIGSDIDVAGLTTLRANAAAVIVLDDAFHDFNEVDATARSIVLTDRDDVTLGAIAANALTVQAGGDITDTATKAIRVAGRADLRATSGGTPGFFAIMLDGDDADATDRPHEFGVFVATGADISVVDVDGIVLGNISANAVGAPASTGDLSVLAGGDITQEAGTSIQAPGQGDIRTTAGLITLANAGNDFADELNAAGSTIAFNAPGAVSVLDIDSIALGASSGTIFTLVATDLSAAGLLDFTTSLALRNSAGDGMVIGNAANDGDADDYDVTDAEVAFIRTAHVFLTTATGDIEFQGAAFDTENLTVDSTAGSTRFGTATTSIAGALTVTAGTGIDQTAQGAIEVAGRTSLTAGGAIALGAAANNFDSDAITADAFDEVDATGTAIALRDTGAIALGAITAESLTVIAGGSVTDTVGDGITVTGATSITALSGTDTFDIRLDGIDGDDSDRPHDFSATAGFSARGEDVLVVDANAIRLGSVITGDTGVGTTADVTIDLGNDGDLIVVAEGDITQGSSAIVVRGNASFTTPGDLTLEAATNDFRNSVDAKAANVSLTDRSSIALGTIETDNLTVTANGTISDTAGRQISVPGTTRLTASDGASAFHDIVLTSLAHDFADTGAAGAFIATGEDLAVVDVDGINFGTVVLNRADGSADAGIAGNAGTLSVVAGGAVTQTGTITARGNASITTPGEILLALQNRFGSSVDADAADVTLTDADALRLGRVRSGGNLSVAAGGAITDTNGRSIEVAGVTSLTARNGTNFFDILLDNANAALGDVHDLGVRVDASGEDIRLTNIDALLLGAVAPHADSTPDRTIDNGNDGDLTVRAGGTVTQQVALTIPGELDVTALDFATGDFFDVLLALGNSIGGIISVAAEDASIRNVGGRTTLGTITTRDESAATVDTTINTGNDGDLTVVSRAGSIVDTAGQAITVGGSTSLLAGGGTNFFDIALDNPDLHDFTGAVSATGEDIVLDDVNAIVLGLIVANESGEDAGGATADATVSFFDDNGDGSSNAADGIASAGDLTVRAGGTITETGQGISVDGRTRLEARSGTTVFDIALDRGVHDFDANAGAPDADQEVDIDGASVVITDASALKLGRVSATGSLSVTAAGSVTDTDGEAITVGGTTSLLAVDAAGTNFFDIALDNPDLHDFTGAVSATGEDIVLDDVNAIVLGLIVANESGEDAGGATADATVSFFDDNGDGSSNAADGIASAGDLTVRAGGTITETGQGISVDGRTRLEARSGTTVFDIALDRGVHDFDANAGAPDADQEVDIDGASVVITDASALKLGRVSATGSLSVTAAGSVTDTVGEAITVGGTTSLLAVDAAGTNFFDIALDNPNLHDFTGAVSATGEDIVLDDVNAIVLGAIVARESGEDAGGATADATVSFFDDNGDGSSDAADGIASAGDLTVRAGGTITETGQGISVDGRTRLEARSGTTVFDIALDRGVHDFDANAGAPDADQEVDIDGANVVITDRSALKLGAVSATGSLSVTAAGSVTDTVGEAITVGGTTSLLAVDAAGTNFFDIALDNPDLHDFTGAVSATGEDIVLDDVNAIVLGLIVATESGEDAGSASADATVSFFDDDGDGSSNATDGIASAGDLTVRAGGTITETGQGISVDGRTRLEARSGTTVFDIALDRGVHDFDANAGAPDADQEVDIDGASVVITDRSALKLGAVSATGSLSVTAAGSVTDTVGEAIIVNQEGSVLRILAAGGDDFFDIALDNTGLHDFNIVDLEGDGIVVNDIQDLTVARIRAHSDAAPDATLPDTGHGGGSIDLTVEAGDVRFQPSGTAVDVRGNPMVLNADGDLTLRAPQGSFAVLSGANSAVATRERLQDGLTFRSAAGNIQLVLSEGFEVTDELGVGPFTLDAAAGTSSIVMGSDPDTTLVGSEPIEFFGIGSADFLAQAKQGGFNPLFVRADINDPQVFLVTGNFSLSITEPVTVRFQNTSIIPNEGDGTTVAGTTRLSGNFAGISMFGTFAGGNRRIAALQGFQNAGGFVLENDNTVNGCVILLPSSCQPIGSLSLSLNFPDGLLLGVKFIDPEEDLDDPFTNRGDEEEWE